MRYYYANVAKKSDRFFCNLGQLGFNSYEDTAVTTPELVDDVGPLATCNPAEPPTIPRAKYVLY